MKKLIRGQNASYAGKLCAFLLVLLVLCPAAPLHAALIESNGTGKYEITGNDTWGLLGPPVDETIDSLIIRDDATLKLVWNDDYPSSPITLGYICGNGDLDINGGGTITCEYNIVSNPTDRPAYMIFGLQNISNININADGIFTFEKLSDQDKAYIDATQDISMPGGSLRADNVKFTPDSDISPFYSYASVFGLNVDQSSKTTTINGDISITLNDSDVGHVGWGGISATKLILNGDSLISLNNVCARMDSSVANTAGGNSLSVSGGGWNTSIYATNSHASDSIFTQNGQSKIVIQNVTVDSEQNGWLTVFAGGQCIGASNEYVATSIVESSHIEIDKLNLNVTGEATVGVFGGGSATTYIGVADDTMKLTQFYGGAESRIVGMSEIILIGDSILEGIASGGPIYCGGQASGEKAISTVGQARLTLKDMSFSGTTFAGVISGQGMRYEYPDGTVGNQLVSDYTDSVLGDSVLVLDNVKADMSSDTDKVTVKYFDEIQLANNTAVKLTTLDGDVKKLTVTGAWGAEVTVLEFKQPVQNFASIAVDCSAASGVTDAYFTDDGMKFIINGTGGTTPEEPAEPEQPSTGGSGGGSGGCNAGFGSFALLAMAAFVSIAGMKFRKK